MPFRPANHRVFWSAGLLALLAIFWMIRWHIMDLDAEVRREGLSSQVVVSARSVLIDVIDIETGLRGYLVASREEYLRPYHEGLGRLSDDLLRLQARVRNDPVETPHVDEVVGISRQVMGEFANQVAIAQTDGIEAGRKRFVEFATKPSMDLIRGHIAAVQVEEDRRLEANRAILDRQMRTTIWLLNGGSMVVLFILASMASGLIRPPADPC